jgi:hypothetical protein
MVRPGGEDPEGHHHGSIRANRKPDSENTLGRPEKVDSLGLPKGLLEQFAFCLGHGIAGGVRLVAIGAHRQSVKPENDQCLPHAGYCLL